MQIEILFITQVVLGVLIIVLLFQLIQMKKKIEHAIEEVQNYIAFITKDVEEEFAEVGNRNDFLPSQKYPSRLQEEIRTEEETQTQLIHAVLQEYFP